MPKSGVTGLARLLETARLASWRIWAAEAPFEQKDRLKALACRWNGEATTGQPRAWYRDVPETEHETELRFLQEAVYGRVAELPMRRITAQERYSARE